MSKIVNSAAGNSVYTVAGVAITDSTQPNINTGSVVAGGTLSQLNGVASVYGPPTNEITVNNTPSIARVDVEVASKVTHADNDGTAVRTRKVASAIRAGEYSFVNGTFSESYPAVANDVAAIGLANDDTTNVTYGQGIGDPVNVDR